MSLGPNLYNGLNRWLRGCVTCGRSPVGRTLLLCEECQRGIDRRPSIQQSHLKGCPSTGQLWARWSWRRGLNDGQIQTLSDSSDRQVSQLVKALKGGHIGHAFWREAATQYTRGDRAISPTLQSLIWVPAPPRTFGQHDHARLWAEALKEAHGGEVWAGLKRSSDSKGDLADELQQQKRHSRHERWKICLEATRDAPKPRTPYRLIFCDDVLTTGATWTAAWRALGRPDGFDAAVLAYRPLEVAG